MTRISRRTRSEAILICAIAASLPAAISPTTAARHLGLDGGAANELATMAWYAADVRLGCGQESMAEAEALLQCGWSPS